MDMRRNKLRTALVIVDVQEAMITGAMYREAEVLDNLQRLLAAARRADAPVIHVRHDYGPGHVWARGSPGWQTWAPLAPRSGEAVFDKTRNSAFYHTGLAQHLKQAEIASVIVTGVHTEFCIDATVRSAFERDLRVLVPACTNSTHGNDYLSAERLYAYYNDFLWPNRYVSTVTLAEAELALTQTDQTL